jgi:hypothetical protein
MKEVSKGILSDRLIPSAYRINQSCRSLRFFINIPPSVGRELDMVFDVCTPIKHIHSHV